MIFWFVMFPVEIFVVGTEDHRYNDSVYSQTYAVKKNLPL